VGYDRWEEVGGSLSDNLYEAYGLSSVTRGQQKIFNGDIAADSANARDRLLTPTESPWVMSIIDFLAMRISRSNQYGKSPLSACYTIKAPYAHV
jgi:hypothetical protein